MAGPGHDRLSPRVILGDGSHPPGRGSKLAAERLRRLLVGGDGLLATRLGSAESVLGPAGRGLRRALGLLRGRGSLDGRRLGRWVHRSVGGVLGVLGLDAGLIGTELLVDHLGLAALAVGQGLARNLLGLLKRVAERTERGGGLTTGRDVGPEGPDQTCRTVGEGTRRRTRPPARAQGHLGSGGDGLALAIKRHAQVAPARGGLFEGARIALRDLESEGRTAAAAELSHRAPPNP